MRVAIVASHAEVDADNTIHMRLSVDMDDGRTPSGWPGRCCASQSTQNSWLTTVLSATEKSRSQTDRGGEPRAVRWAIIAIVAGQRAV